MSRLRKWWKQTILNVLNPNGRIRYVATPWDENDITADFRKSKEWDIAVRHALETDGEMDYNGQPIHYGPTPEGGDGIKEARAREKMALDEMRLPLAESEPTSTPSPPLKAMTFPAPGPVPPTLLGAWPTSCTPAPLPRA